MNYQQDLGQVVVYDEYLVGDTVEFAGSNWKVIKNSTAEEDYVTLMKETILTNSELGEYALGTGYETMSYYWDDNCHPTAYGYSRDSWSCDNTNSYATSKVKEVLETRYLPTIGETNLKEVDGYKIRLITVDELTSNLGCVNDNCTSSQYATWLYQNCEGRILAYWTMTPDSDNSSSVWYVTSSGQIYHYFATYYHRGVRPVINLLKSAIE